jgi:hypothetical protein
LTELFMAEPATPAAEALAHVKSKKVEHHLPDQCAVCVALTLRACTLAAVLCCAGRDVLRVVWTALMRSVNMTGKNQQQVTQVREVQGEGKTLDS